MAIAYFASKVFSVSFNRVYTFDDFSRSGGLDIEEQELEGQKPSSYIKGSTLEEVSFTVGLIQQNSVDVQSEINDWMNIKDSKSPYLLILNNSPISNNKFLLTNVSVQDAAFDIKGRYIKAKLQLQFKEFVRYGAKKEDAGTSSSSKKTKKRDNTNATMSAAQGAELDELEAELYGG